MSAVLRVMGENLDVDAFLAKNSWEPVQIFRKGELRFESDPEGRKVERSGFNLTVSEAGLRDFTEQVREAIAFLQAHQAEIQRLVAFPGGVEVGLNFGVAWREASAHNDWLPAELIWLAGACGIGVGISHYAVSDGLEGASSKEAP